VFNEELSAQIHGSMALALWWSVLTFTLLYVYLLDRRYRLEVLDADRDERELERAIAERLAESESTPRIEAGVRS
jgi:C4-dicarboxylate-specific signal transduction histidine kinase